MFGNLFSVTLGNIIGGALLIGAVYWVITILPQKKTRIIEAPEIP